jgi:hypothetical protein
MKDVAASTSSRTDDIGFSHIQAKLTSCAPSSNGALSADLNPEIEELTLDHLSEVSGGGPQNGTGPHTGAGNG